MNDIHTLDAERDNLELHVDLCAQRYLILEKRLEILETKVDRITETISKGKDSLSKVIITSTGTLFASLLGLIITILMKF